jgi:hypothetical protein
LFKILQAMGAKKELGDVEVIYRSMIQQLEAVGEGRGDNGSYSQELEIVRFAIVRLRSAVPERFADEAAERAFFAAIWPKFYGKFFFFLLVQRLAFVRGVLPVEVWPVMMRREAVRVTKFFRRHREFWRYYKAGTEQVLREFTRAYSQACVFDPLSLVLDPHGATLASYRAAWGLAYEEYLDYLREMGEQSVGRGRLRYEWKETRSAAVELIKAQAESKSVYVNGQPATAGQLRAVWEELFGIKLGNFEKLLYALDARKDEEPSYYLVKLAAGMKARRDRLQK